MERIVAAAAFAALIAVNPAAARAGDIDVTVTVSGGKSITSGTLIVEDRVLPLAAGGRMQVKGLPDKRLPVTVEAVVGGARHLGVTAVKTLKGKSLPVTVTLKQVTDLEAFCVECHPNKGEAVRADQVIRDTHVTGIALTARYLAQVEKYNAASEQQRREKVKDPQLPILLEKRVVQVEGKDVVKKFVTCESCHTIHVLTPWARRVRGPYRKSSVFCEGCHP